MIFTTYFGKVKDLPEYIIPVSICGKAPSWWKGLEYKALAPKWDFFKVWKETHDNDYYIEHFQTDVLDKLDIEKVLIDLHFMMPLDLRMNMGKLVAEDCNYHIALVCYEKPDAFCHRHLVARWLEKRGIKVRELIYFNKELDWSQNFIGRIDYKPYK